MSPEPGESKVAFGGISDVGLRIEGVKLAMNANWVAQSTRYISVTPLISNTSDIS